MKARGAVLFLSLPRSFPIVPSLLRSSTLSLALIAVVAAICRVVPWLANYPLHRDEALYGYWARLIASGGDPLLLGPWIDKPPLAIYLLAGSLRAFGVSELALRLPGMVASLAALFLVYRIAHRLYGSRPALIAAGLWALSPFAILFAPTAFTDPWLTLWLAAGTWAALAGRPFWAGAAVGLAVASKQQGVLVAALVIGLLLAPNDRQPGTKPRCETAGEHAAPRSWFVARRWLAAILGFALVFGPLTWWDSLRWHNRPSFWDRSLTTYGGLGLAQPWQWPQRAADWAAQLGFLFGAPVLTAAVSGLAGWAAIHEAREHRQIGPGPLLALYICAYLALHLFGTFRPWDRYLLPLLPLICILAGRGVEVVFRTGAHVGRGATADEKLTQRRQDAEAVRRTQRSLAPFAPLREASRVIFRPAILAPALALALTYAAWLGVGGRLPVGSAYAAYGGVDRLMATLHDRPADAVIYHHSLGWHLDYYLFDAPQERRWWDAGPKLAADAAATAQAEPARSQWLALTIQQQADVSTLQADLAAEGLLLADAELFRRPDGDLSFVLYRILPLSGQDERSAVESCPCAQP